MGEDGRPAASITLGGGGEAAFYRITGENIGKPLAIIYVETALTPVVVNARHNIRNVRVSASSASPLFKALCPVLSKLRVYRV